MCSDHMLSSIIWERGHTSSLILKVASWKTPITGYIERGFMHNLTGPYVHCAIDFSPFCFNFFEKDPHGLFPWTYQMDSYPTIYVGYSDDISRYLINLSSATWVMYSPVNALIHISVECIGESTNNHAKYNVLIGILNDALHSTFATFMFTLIPSFLLQNWTRFIGYMILSCLESSYTLKNWLDPLIPLHSFMFPCVSIE